MVLPNVMAIDAGTGSCRCLIFDIDGHEIAVAQREWTHEQDAAIPGAFDFDTARNGAVVDEVIRGALGRPGVTAENIKAVAATSMREGIVLYDKAGHELWACPNIDARATKEADELVEFGLADLIYDTAGDWVSVTTPARLKWLTANRPDVMERASHLGLISDWVATRLSSEFSTEPSAGSSTALFDLGSRQWSKKLFAALQIEPSIAPPVVEAGTPIGRVTKAAAKRTGLRAGTPVIAGGGDTQLGLVGLNRSIGDGTLLGGSFWQMTVLLDRPAIDPSRGPRTLCHARPGQWMVEAIGFLSGLSLRWFRDAFCDAEAKIATQRKVPTFALLNELARAVPPGANGVTAVMASIMQTNRWLQASPTLLGFDFNRPEFTGKAAALRAIMEAAAYVAHVHRLMLEKLIGRRFDRIQFGGGGAQGTLWPEIIADVMGLPVSIPTNRETTALGCAMLAAVGAGLYADLNEASRMVSPIEREVQPNLQRTEKYRDLCASWQRVNEAMVDLAELGVTNAMWRPAGAVKRRSPR